MSAAAVSPGTPRVSVIVPAYESDAVIGRCIDALRAQTYTDFETVVVDSSPRDATERMVGERFDEVRLERSSERLLPHAARNRGVAVARGELLVFTDPDCRARPDWLDRLVTAHDRGHAVVGGAIELSGRGWFARGVHLCKFSAWIPGGSPGRRRDLATANVLWERAVWDRVGPFPTQLWSGDTALSWRTREAGIGLRFEPAAVVEHLHEAGPRAFVRERRVRGEDFARLRIEDRRWSRVRAALALLVSPVVAPLLAARSLRRCAGSGRLAEGLVTLPVQLAGYVAWSLGEARSEARRVLGSTGSTGRRK